VVRQMMEAQVELASMSVVLGDGYVLLSAHAATRDRCCRTALHPQRRGHSKY